MAKLTTEQTMLRAKSHEKKGEVDQARLLYKTILDSFPNNKRAQQALAGLNEPKSVVSNKGINPPQDQLNALLELYNEGQLSAAVDKAQLLVLDFPSSFVLWNILGAANKGLGRTEDAASAFKRVTELNPTYADGFNNLGATLQDQGKLDEAIAAYNKALSIKPDHAAAHNNLGNTLQDQGKFNDAIGSYQRALKIKPDYAEAHNNMGNVLKDQGKFEETIEAYQRALKFKPDYAEAHNNMGIVLKDQSKIEDAIGSYQRALKFKPDYADAHYNMGVTLQHQGKLNDAIEAYQRALKIKPDYAEAHNNMGIALQDQSKFKDAIEAYQCALKINPDYAEAHNNMGIALQDQCKFEDAIEAYQRALKIKPDYAEAHNNMGNVLKDQGKFEETIEAYQRALKFKPDYAETHYNMGVVLKDQGKLDEAIEAYKRALKIKPDYAEAHNNMGQALLMNYDFTKGFRSWEWRWKTKQNIGKELASSKPKWEGQKGRRVLLWAEQGIGTEIMFASLIPELNVFCSKLIVQCDKRLIPLFERSFSPNIIYQSKQGSTQETEYDFQISNASLAEILRISLDSFPKPSGAYLQCKKSKSDELRKLISKNGARKLIGISWHSASVIQGASHRNVALEQLAGHLCDNGTEIVSLQYGDISEQISQLKQSSGINVTEVKEIDNHNDIDGLAALISACDLVVSIDNVTAHLAGALGVDTKVLLPFSPDWRWGVKQPSSYWHSSLQLYHQHRPNEWEEVFVELRKGLRN